MWCMYRAASRWPLGLTSLLTTHRRPRTAAGYTDLGETSAEFHRNTAQMLAQSMQILGTCIKEAPERDARKRAAAHRV